MRIQSQQKVRAKLDEIVASFEVEFRNGNEPRIEDFYTRCPGEERRLLRTLIRLEIELRRDINQEPHVEDYEGRFATIDPDIVVAIVSEELQKTIVPSEDAIKSRFHGNDTQPLQIAHYKVKRRLGHGSFGYVYLAHDLKLDRPVALKVLREKWLRDATRIDALVTEARKAAQLRHPGLVSVYGIEEDADGNPFIVQEYIRGEQLGNWASARQPTLFEIIKVFSFISEALRYAHQRGLTHCDLKLANVLVDSDGVAHVADFGLAVSHDTQSALRGAKFGSPVTMAPEQVRGEGHLLDGRTDIWAIGVMIYELVTGHRPFDAVESNELFDQIQTREPRPLRQWNFHIPREIERICLKCLQKLPADRYQSADDLRSDLKAWIDANDGSNSFSSSNQILATVIPKGIRSFDEHDAEFFLDLLPGPRDRNGIPESVRFWSERIEEFDVNRTFRVGVLYGPSGCGKSSFIKAGLIPRLRDTVIPVYVDSSESDTEARLEQQLNHRLPHVSSCKALQEYCEEIRIRSRDRKQKVLLVIDQFEQWLHSCHDVRDSDLVKALRQCDGVQLQCLLIVRDDFWMAIARFMRELEVPLREYENSRAAELIPETHAIRVLQAFGHAYHALPEDPGSLTSDQQQFITNAIRELRDEHGVNCAHLALFAHLMRDQEWTMERLRSFGGTSGMGTAFLDQCFSSNQAPPEYKYYQRAVNRVLSSLLPQSESQIRSVVNPLQEIQKVAGYTDDADFKRLLEILDKELRLITPVDSVSESRLGSDDKQRRCYRLTHDLLVPSVRRWLNNRRSIAERMKIWCVQPERISNAAAFTIVTAFFMIFWEVVGIFGIVSGKAPFPDVDPDVAVPLLVVFAVLGLVQLAIGLIILRGSQVAVVVGFVGALVSMAWTGNEWLGTFAYDSSFSGFTLGGLFADHSFRSFAFCIFFFYTMCLTAWLLLATIARFRIRHL